MLHRADHGDKRTFNVLTGLSESWRITGAAQWKIFAYFILLGIAFLVIAMILGAVVGFSVFASGGMPGAGSMVGLIVGSGAAPHPPSLRRADLTAFARTAMEDEAMQSVATINARAR